MNNSSKISYWRRLRRLTAKLVVVVGILMVIILSVLLGFQKFTSFFFDPLMLNVILVIALDLLIYLAIVNAILLFLEFLNHILKIKTIPVLKKIFKVILILLTVIPLLIYLAFLVLADPRYVHLVA